MCFRHLVCALALAVSAKGVIGGEFRITSVDKFIEFREDVRNGNYYSGTTVFLDSDLSLAGKTFNPIGNSYSSYFRGTFDGQGHVISNLKMSSSSLQYIGLFGYSGGLTIKNVILDSSCSITSSSYGSDYKAYIGGIIGYCYAGNGLCTIENSVNMGSISFSGTVNELYGGDLYLGGIVGHLYGSRNYETTVKNCANYGVLTHSRESVDSYIGGIVGYSYGYSYSNRVHIYNSLNHGTITHKDTSSSLYLGGIAGRTSYTTIENCVSGRSFSLSTKGSSDNYIGSIVGEVYSDTSISCTYFTSYLSKYNNYGKGTPSESNTLSYDSTSFELSGTVSIGDYTGTSLIGALNVAADYYTLRDYSHWLLNKENNAVSLTINKKSTFTLNAQVILLPSLASEGKLGFDGWYTDDGLTTPLTEFEVTSDTELYGRFEENINNYTISFETRKEGVSVPPITAPFGSVVTLPSDLVREHCSFLWWENMYGDYVGLSLTMPFPQHHPLCCLEVHSHRDT